MKTKPSKHLTLTSLLAQHLYAIKRYQAFAVFAAISAIACACTTSLMHARIESWLLYSVSLGSFVIGSLISSRAKN